MSSSTIKFIPENFYHIYNHGNGDENIFREEENYYYFLKKYSEHINPVAKTYAYCLMPNHFHFLAQIRSTEEIKANLLKSGRNLEGLEDLPGLISKQFSNLLNGYTKAFNLRFERNGRLFLYNLKRKQISNPSYLSRCIHYIHSNPIHHGFTKHLEDWPYCSYHAYLSMKKTSIEREEAIKWFGSLDKFTEIHREALLKNVLMELES